MQGLLELADVAFVGSGVLGSAMSMDKLKAKDVLAGNGIPQVPWLGLRDVELADAPARVRDAALRYPPFVQPATPGSSLGVARVADSAANAHACPVAAAYNRGVGGETGENGRD